MPEIKQVGYVVRRTLKQSWVEIYEKEAKAQNTKFYHYPDYIQPGEGYWRATGQSPSLNIRWGWQTIQEATDNLNYSRQEAEKYGYTVSWDKYNLLSVPRHTPQAQRRDQL